MRNLCCVFLLFAGCAAQKSTPVAATGTTSAAPPAAESPPAAASAAPAPVASPEPEVEREASLVVDHAWVKDAATPASTKKNRALLDKLRTKVAAGATIPAAFSAMKIPGEAWHIGDHEEYPLSVLPETVRTLGVGALSPVIAGDGGLHLFKIHERKIAK